MKNKYSLDRIKDYLGISYHTQTKSFDSKFLPEKAFEKFGITTKEQYRDLLIDSATEGYDVIVKALFRQNIFVKENGFNISAFDEDIVKKAIIEAAKNGHSLIVSKLLESRLINDKTFIKSLLKQPNSVETLLPCIMETNYKLDASEMQGLMQLYQRRGPILGLILDTANKHDLLPSGKDLTILIKNLNNGSNLQDSRKILVKNGANPKDLELNENFTKEDKKELVKIYDTRKEITRTDKKEVYKIIKDFTNIIKKDETLTKEASKEAIAKLEKIFKQKFEDKSSDIDFDQLEKLATELHIKQKEQPEKTCLEKLWSGLKSLFRGEYQNLKQDTFKILEGNPELIKLKSSLKSSIVDDVEKKLADNVKKPTTGKKR
ncbi:MAG: hypothetical protein ACK4OM_02820 [Alphaproteobacteria bacterium]